MARSSRSRSRSRGRRRGSSPLSVGSISVTHKGYAFVDTPEGTYFVPPGFLHGAMNGDLIEVVRVRRLENQQSHQAGRSLRGSRTSDETLTSKTSSRKDLVGSVQRVLERSQASLIGVVRVSDGPSRVIPDDERCPYDIFLDLRHKGCAAKDGDVVVVRITTYPSRREAAQGYIEEVLGREDDQGMDMAVIVRKHGFETEFSLAALAEAEALSCGTLTPSSCVVDSCESYVLAENLKRRDLRDRVIFTIDPHDARDFDDALSLDYVEGVLRLGVHIADVSAYVAWDSAIDINARRRATSVYLPDRVIPMLPPVLADDICSLLSDTDRLALTVDLYLNKDAVVERAEFYPSLIRSQARLTYGEVQELLEGTPPQTDLTQKLMDLNKLAKKLAWRRTARGAIDFESAEPQLVLDETGKPLQVQLRKKTDATALVEEAMIAANEAVARYLLSHDEPCVYRIHDEPLQSTLDDVLPILQEFGYSGQQAPQSSTEIQELLSASKSKAEYDLISTLFLRAMKRARYHKVFTTHFGLASQAYAHFTSPIRRYPDLLVHRLLKLRLRAEQSGFSSTEDFLKAHPDRAMTNMVAQLDWMCEHCSNQEREAEQATYEAIKLKLCEFFAGRIGIRCGGVISGVNTYGFYVREDTTHAEGFVSRELLDDLFTYEAARHRWVNHSTKKQYRLGQPLMVTLCDVDLVRMELKFTL